jgi:ParB family chromosome partitioning protein
VQTLDGFAAFINTAISTPRSVLVCLDPEAMGYVRTGHSYFKSDQARAAEEAERQANVARAAALTDAQEIREQFLCETYGNAKAARALYLDALRAAVIRSGTLGG